VHYFITLIIIFLAIAMIKSHPRPITSYKEAAALRGVGAKMAQKIMEILDYGKLSKVDICAVRKTSKFSFPILSQGKILAYCFRK
jgi:hypothetical protein